MRFTVIQTTDLIHIIRRDMQDSYCSDYRQLQR